MASTCEMAGGGYDQDTYSDTEWECTDPALWTISWFKIIKTAEGYVEAPGSRKLMRVCSDHAEDFDVLSDCSVCGSIVEDADSTLCSLNCQIADNGGEWPDVE